MNTSKGTSGARGITFEILTCMLLFVRGFTRNLKNFHLYYQVSEAKKFDDIIFDESGDNYQLIQLKHKENDNSKKMTHSQIFNDTFNSDYNLLKYIKAVKDINSEPKFKNKIKYAVVFTNIGFDFHKNQSLSLKVNLSANQKLWYEGYERLKPTETVIDYNAVFDCSNVFTDAKYYSFTNDDIVLNILKKQAVTLENHVGNLTEDEMREALKYIIYAVSQPNDNKLEEIIKWEIQDHFKLEYVNDIYNSLHVAMKRWCDTKSGEFSSVISFRDAERFFQSNHRTISFDVLPPTTSFIGRVKQLNQIRDQLYEERDIVVSQTVAISGLGGMGKTELARQFIKQFGQSDFYGRCIWIRAENDTSVEDSFKRLAETLNINLNGKQYTKTIINEVFNYFEGYKVLFVFDNFDTSPEENCENYVKYCRQYVIQPNKKSRPCFLFTSRNNNCIPNILSLNLSTLTKEEAVELIETQFSKFNFTPEKKDTEKLAEVLQCFPLALQQAIAYVKQQRTSVFGGAQNYDIHCYLKEFETRKQYILNHKYEDDFGDCGRTTFITWNVTFNAIEKDKCGELAIKILQFLAYLYADEIDAHIFISNSLEQEHVSKSIELLEKYSLITKIEGKNLYQIHRLVQAVIRLKFQSNEKHILKQTVKLIIPNALKYYRSKQRFLNILIRKNSKNNSSKYDECVKKCTVTEALHLNSVSVYLKTHNKLFKKYVELFDDISFSGFIEIVFNDDIEKIKMLHMPEKRLKKFLNENFEELIKRKCNEVIKYFVQKSYLNVKSHTKFADETPLYYAVKYENVDIVKIFLEKGANANLRTKEDHLLINQFNENQQVRYFLYPRTFFEAKDMLWLPSYENFITSMINENHFNIISADCLTLIHLICISKEFESSLKHITFLVEKGVDVNAKDLEGRTALYYALIKRKSTKIIAYLISKSTLVNDKILKLSIQEDNLDAVNCLFQKKFTRDHKFTDGRNLVEVAIENFSLKVLLFLKSEFTEFYRKGGDVNKRNKTGDNLLIHCIKQDVCHLGDIIFLVENGVNVDTKDNYANSAIFFALIKNNIEVFNYLLSKLVSVDEYVLKFAIQKDNLIIVKILFERHFKRNHQFSNGTTPIEVAVKHFALNVLLFLRTEFVDFCKNGGEVNIIDKHYNPFLIQCIEKGICDLDDIKFLVENGMDVNAKNYNGYNAIYYAIFYDKISIFLYLCNKVDSVDEQTLELAIEKNNSIVLKELFNKHFKIDYRFQNGKTLFEIAKEKNQREAAEFLNNLLK